MSAGVSLLFAALASVLTSSNDDFIEAFEFAPPNLVYRPYIADPRRPTTSLTLSNVLDATVPFAGDTRWGVRIGNRFPIVGWGTSNGLRLQVEGEIGFFAQFDRDNSSDNLGWDGVYGFDLAISAMDDVQWRVGISHDSSHLGDEYIDDTGFTRVGYTREELRLGVAWDIDANWRVYAEYGHGIVLRAPDFMERGRVQTGLEYEASGAREAFRPFTALDVSSFAEDDWEPNFALITGVVRHLPQATWRFGVEFLDGRNPIGELSRSRETQIAIGFWVDF